MVAAPFIVVLPPRLFLATTQISNFPPLITVMGPADPYHVEPSGDIGYLPPKLPEI